MEELGSRETAIFSVKTDKPDKLILLFGLNREQAAALFLKLLQDCVVEPVRFLGGEGAGRTSSHADPGSSAEKVPCPVPPKHAGSSLSVVK